MEPIERRREFRLWAQNSNMKLNFNHAFHEEGLSSFSSSQKSQFFFKIRKTIFLEIFSLKRRKHIRIDVCFLATTTETHQFPSCISYPNKNTYSVHTNAFIYLPLSVQLRFIFGETSSSHARLCHSSFVLSLVYIQIRTSCVYEMCSDDSHWMRACEFERSERASDRTKERLSTSVTERVEFECVYVCGRRFKMRCFIFS